LHGLFRQLTKGISVFTGDPRCDLQGSLYFRVVGGVSNSASVTPDGTPNLGLCACLIGILADAKGLVGANPVPRGNKP
jgi:hypothetical protein